MTNTKLEDKASEAWLRRMADVEDEHGPVTVGGLAHDLGMLRPVARECPRIFGRLIEFARRSRALSVEELAKAADIDLGELVGLECGADIEPTPRTVHQLAHVLGVSTGKLLVVAGLADAEDETLKEATLRFAARSEPTTKLSKPERDALDEFVKVLVERSDKK